MSRGRLLVLGSTAVLVLLGLVVLASAEAVPGRFLRQIVWVAAGAVCAGAAAYLGTGFFFRWSYAFYGLAVFLLVGVLFSRPVFGVRAWFDLYLFKIQPAELSRTALVLVLARILAGWGRPRPLAPREPAPPLKDVAAAAALTGVMVLLVLLEPDIGVALGMLFIFGGSVFASGVSKKVLAAGLAAALVLGGGMYAFGLSDQQKERVTAWLSPEDYRKSSAWQMVRSQLAVGSGGLTGKGWGKGEVNRLKLLPVKDSDFIFSVLAEELGFLAVALLVAACIALVSGCFLEAIRTRDRPYALLCVAVGTYFGAQAALNMAVALGVLPTTGVTLPFISYGGSSMLSNLVMVGFVLSGGERRDHLHQALAI